MISTAGTLASRQALISVQPYVVSTQSSGSALSVAGAALTLDTVRCTILENTRNPATGLSSFRNYQVVAQREAEQRAELAAAPEVVATVPYFDTDIYDLAGLLRLAESIWS